MPIPKIILKRKYIYSNHIIYIKSNALIVHTLIESMKGFTLNPLLEISYFMFWILAIDIEASYHRSFHSIPSL